MFPLLRLSITVARLSFVLVLGIFTVACSHLERIDAFLVVGRAKSIPLNSQIKKYTSSTPHLLLAATNDDQPVKRVVGPKAGNNTRNRRTRSSDSRQRQRQQERRDSFSKEKSSIRTRSEEQRKQQQQQQQQQQQCFDGKQLAANQSSNIDAPSFDLISATTFSSNDSCFLRCVTPGLRYYDDDDDILVPSNNKRKHARLFEYRSLDDLFACTPSFSLSQKFNSDEQFRSNLRSAIRLDIFQTTPYYQNLSEKAASILLLPDSSLEGSWRIPMSPATTSMDTTTATIMYSPSPRMKHTTQVLNQAFQEHDKKYGLDSDSSMNSTSNDNINNTFDGDDLFRALGDICGHGASTHWIDICGVQDRKINHGWHFDAGQSPNECRTVLWGFPQENHYIGTGVFSHIIPLQSSFDTIVDTTNDDANTESEHHQHRRRRMEPVLYDGTVDDRYIVRPFYEPGKELLIYRDVDILHSAPDVAYRTSVMRFM